MVVINCFSEVRIFRFAIMIHFNIVYILILPLSPPQSSPFYPHYDSQGGKTTAPCWGSLGGHSFFLACGQNLPTHTEKFRPVWVKETLFTDVLRLYFCFDLSLLTNMKYHFPTWKSYLPLDQKKGVGDGNKKILGRGGDFGAQWVLVFSP